MSKLKVIHRIFSNQLVTNQKISYLIIAFIFLSCSRYKHSDIKSYYDNGQKKIEILTKNKNDSLNYRKIYYHENGQIWYDGLFINNEKQGHWIWYYDNGIKADEAWFENGNYIDSIYHWDSTGNIEHIEYLSRKCNDRELKSCNSCCCDGKNIWFDSSGNIYAEYYIVNGELDSTYTYFYPDGKVLEIYRYNKGKKNGVSEKYNKNGRLITKAKYRNNKLNGIYTEWDSLGNLIFNGEAINDSIYKK